MGSPQTRAVAALFPASHGLFDARRDVPLELRSNSSLARGREVDEPHFDRHREPYSLRRRGLSQIGSGVEPLPGRVEQRVLPADREVAQRARRLRMREQHREDHRHDRHAGHAHEQLRSQRHGDDQRAAHRRIGEGNGERIAHRSNHDLAQQDQEAPGEKAGRGAREQHHGRVEPIPTLPAKLHREADEPGRKQPVQQADHGAAEREEHARGEGRLKRLLRQVRLAPALEPFDDRGHRAPLIDHDRPREDGRVEEHRGEEPHPLLVRELEQREQACEQNAERGQRSEDRERVHAPDQAATGRQLGMRHSSASRAESAER